MKDPLVRLPFPVECPPSRCTVYKIGVNDLQVVIVIFYITPAIKMRFSQIVNYCNYKSVNLSPISLIGLTSKFTFIWLTVSIFLSQWVTENKWFFPNTVRTKNRKCLWTAGEHIKTVRSSVYRFSFCVYNPTVARRQIPNPRSEETPPLCLVWQQKLAQTSAISSKDPGWLVP